MLTTVCEVVFGIETDVSGIIRDMMCILTNSKNGVGLAANQAGYAKRIIIITDSIQDWLPMINPKIIERSDDMVMGTESCLSYPGRSKNIERHKSIEVAYRTINPTSGETEVFEETFRGWLARIIQHEIDHLDGQCIVGKAVAV